MRALLLTLHLSLYSLCISMMASSCSSIFSLSISIANTLLVFTLSSWAFVTMAALYFSSSSRNWFCNKKSKTSLIVILGSRGSKFHQFQKPVKNVTLFSSYRQLCISFNNYRIFSFIWGYRYSKFKFNKNQYPDYLTNR